MRIHRVIVLKKVKGRILPGEGEIGLKKRADRPDILPVVIENITAKFALSQKGRNHFFPEVGHVVLQGFSKHLAVE